jgi:hypothetical protein
MCVVKRKLIEALDAYLTAELGGLESRMKEKVQELREKHLQEKEKEEA